MILCRRETRDAPEAIDQQVRLEDGDEEKQQETRREHAAEPQRPERQSIRTAGGVRKPQQRYVHHTSVRKSLAEYCKPAFDAAISDLKQLYKEERVLKPVLRNKDWWSWKNR